MKENLKGSITEKTSIQNYSINMLWINKKLDKEKPYITTAKNEFEFIKKSCRNNILTGATKWRDANPKAITKVWFDGNFVTKEQIAKTQELIVKLSKKSSAPILLCDIREIDIVSKNKDAFSSYIPIYTRVDLMKLIICIHEMEHNNQQVAIFSDTNVCRLKEDGEWPDYNKLFNPELLMNLKKYGLIQIKSGYSEAENKFYQTYNNPKTIELLKLFVNGMFEYINVALNLTYEDSLENANLDKEYSKKRSIASLSEVVYVRQNRLFALIESEVNNIPITVEVCSRNGQNPKRFKFNPQNKMHLDVFFGNLINQQVFSTVLFVKSKPLKNNEDFYPVKVKLNDLEISDYIYSVSTKDPLSKSFFNVCARSDIICPFGNRHIEDCSKLVEQQPSDGTKTYKVTFYNIERLKEKAGELITFSRDLKRKPDLSKKNNAKPLKDIKVVSSVGLGKTKFGFE